jgi:hypothetical protein
MKVLRDSNTNVSQRYKNTINSKVIPQPGTVVAQMNVSQYAATGSELQDLENSKHWAGIAEGFADQAHDDAERASTFADVAQTHAISAQESAAAAGAFTDKSKEWAEYSEHQAGLSQVSAEESAASASGALGHEINAETALASAIEARDKSKEYRDTSGAHAAEAKESEISASEYKNSAFDSKELAYQWAEGYPQNSSKYWADRAMSAATTAIVSGGTWAPTSAAEYPTVLDETVNTMFFVQFETEFETYTFSTGPFAGKTTSSQDVMFWEVNPVPKWSLMRSPLSNSVMSVNGKTGNIITLLPSDLGAYTKVEVDNAIRTRVPNTRLVNGKALSSDISLGPSDVGAYSKMESNNLLLLKTDKTTTINKYPLSSNIILDYDDVGARPNTWLPTINEISGTIDFGTF